MSSAIEATRQRIADLEASNERYQRQHEAPPTMMELAGSANKPPAICIISCVDPRVIPEKYLDFGVGEHPVIRTAGGRSVDALRSIAVLDKALGLNAVLVVHHTDCGLSHMTNAQIRDNVKQSLAGNGVFSGQSLNQIDGYEFGEIAHKDFTASLKHDTKAIRDSGWFRPDMLVKGYLYDLIKGSVVEICEA